MNGRERVISVLEGRIPDRIPHFEWSIVDSIIQQANVWPKLGWSYVDFVDFLDIDAVVAWPLYETTEVASNLFKDEIGIVRMQGQEDYAMPIDSFAPIKTKSDLDRFRFPDPGKTLCWLQLRNLVKRYKGEKAIIMKLRDVFSWPRELRGYENFMIDILLDPEMVKELIRISVEYTKKQATIAVEIGAEIIVTADDIATNSGLLFSPTAFRDYFLPKYRELVHFIKEQGAFVIKHSDGNVMSIIDDLVESGIDCLYQ